MKTRIILLGILASIFLPAMTTPRFSKEDLLGKIDPAKHPDFTRIADRYTNKENIYMRTAAYAAFEKLFYDAKKNGFDLEIVSATRPFGHQKSIWDRKWKRERYAGMSNKEKALDILLYSSMPGTSRHHWGTDIDLNALNNEYFESGKGKALYTWLQDCGPNYGFHQTYTPKASGRTGYEEEKWHWSYLPISGPMLQAYDTQISYSDITGFEGAEIAEEIGMIENYVKGINPELLNKEAY